MPPTQRTKHVTDQLLVVQIETVLENLRNNNLLEQYEREKVVDGLMQTAFPREPSERLLSGVIKLAKSRDFVCKLNGGVFLSRVMTKYLSYVKDIHNTFKSVLSEDDITSSEIACYGDIYKEAFIAGNERARQIIKKVCVEDLVKAVPNLPRLSQHYEPGEILLKIMIILEKFHAGNYETKCLMGEVLDPVVWLGMNEPNPVERCNVVQIFLQGFPLTKPTSGRRSGLQAYRQKQEEALSRVLMDKNQWVRFISVREVCRIMAKHWMDLPQNVIERCTEAIMNSTTDTASSRIRGEAHKGIMLLVDQPLATQWLKKVLPFLNGNQEDDASYVRLKFAELLCHVGQTQRLLFSEIVPMRDLLLWLECERDQETADKLVQLMFDSFCPLNADDNTLTVRLCSLILLNSNAARKLFAHSKSVLNVAGAVAFMCDLLDVMYKDLQSRHRTVGNTDSRDSTVVQSKRGQKRKKTKAAKKKVGVLIGVDDVSARAKQMSMGDPLIAPSIMDIVSILWTVHRAQVEYSQYYTDLLDILSKALPVFADTFKDGEALHSVLHLACYLRNSPESWQQQLQQISFRALEKSCDEEHNDDLLSYLFYLVHSGMGDQLLHQFQQAMFNVFSASPNSQRTRAKRLECERLLTQVYHPAQVLRMLQIILDTGNVLPPILLEHHYAALCELRDSMESVQNALESRLLVGQQFQGIATDEFLKDSFLMYGRLLVFISQDFDGKEEAITKVLALINWTKVTLLPYMDNMVSAMDDNRLSIEAIVLQCTLHIINSLLMNGTHSADLIVSSLQFTSQLLESECSALMLTGIWKILLSSSQLFKAYFYFPFDANGLFEEHILPQTLRCLQLLPGQCHDHNCCVAADPHTPADAQSVCNVVKFKHLASLIEDVLFTSSCFYKGSAHYNSVKTALLDFLSNMGQTDAEFMENGVQVSSTNVVKSSQVKNLLMAVKQLKWCRNPFIRE